MTIRENAANMLEQVLNLPRTHQQTIPADFMDLNGHMNVMYYTAMGNQAIGRFLENIGLRDQLFVTGQRGTFALRQVISYLNELREGEEIAVHTGLVNYDAKRLHFMHYIVSLTHHRLASSDERLGTYIDMTTRRTTPFEPAIVRQLERVRQQYASLGWEPELSGAIKLKNEGGK